MAKKPETMEIVDSELTSEYVDNMPLTTYSEYKKYNAAARKMNKKLKMCRHKCIPCPEELHPKEKVIITNNEQPQNVFPITLSNHLIDYNLLCEPNTPYEVPLVVINYSEGKNTPRWEAYDLPDGQTKTRQVAGSPKFSIRRVREDDEWQEM